MIKFIFKVTELILTKISFLFPNSEIKELFNGETVEQQVLKDVNKSLDEIHIFGTAILSRGNIPLQMPLQDSPDNRVKRELE